jgi:hypothetical protein
MQRENRFTYNIVNPKYFLVDIQMHMIYHDLQFVTNDDLLDIYRIFTFYLLGSYSLLPPLLDLLSA